MRLCPVMVVPMPCSICRISLLCWVMAAVRLVVKSLWSLWLRFSISVFTSCLSEARAFEFSVLCFSSSLQMLLTCPQASRLWSRPWLVSAGVHAVSHTQPMDLHFPSSGTGPARGCRGVNTGQRIRLVALAWLSIFVTKQGVPPIVTVFC